MAHPAPMNDASPAWRALPSTQARVAELAAIAASPEVRALSDADAITALNRAFAALDAANPIPDMHAAGLTR